MDRRHLGASTSDGGSGRRMSVGGVDGSGPANARTTGTFPEQPRLRPVSWTQSTGPRGYTSMPIRSDAGVDLVRRRDPQGMTRLGRITVALGIVVGTLSVLVAIEPAPERPVEARGIATDPAPRVGGRDVATASPLPSSLPTPTASVGPAVASLQRPRPIRDAVPATPVSLPAGAKAVFLGDSYTTGWNGAGLGRRGWPALVTRARHWHMANLAVAGTGFMNPGWTGQPIGSRVPAVIRQRPDVVFIVGGHNDSRWSSATTATAADKVILRLHQALPDAVLVVVAPIWSNGRPPQRCLDLRDHLRRTARSVGAVFVDPLREGWFAGKRQHMIGPDGLHPTDAGHRFIADQFVTALSAVR